MTQRTVAALRIIDEDELLTRASHVVPEWKCLHSTSFMSPKLCILALHDLFTLLHTKATVGRHFVIFRSKTVRSICYATHGAEAEIPAFEREPVGDTGTYLRANLNDRGAAKCAELLALQRSSLHGKNSHQMPSPQLRRTSAGTEAMILHTKGKQAGSPWSP